MRIAIMLTFLIAMVIACRDERLKVPIRYPNKKYYIGQNLQEFKKECNCNPEKAETDYREPDMEYYIVKDSIKAPNAAIRQLITFEKGTLVRFYCSYYPLGDFEDLSKYLRNYFDPFVSDTSIYIHETNGDISYEKRTTTYYENFLYDKYYHDNGDSISKSFKYYIEDLRYSQYN